MLADERIEDFNMEDGVARSIAIKGKERCEVTYTGIQSVVYAR
jgi:hypothetical protein